jgi:hypothetical protein
MVLLSLLRVVTIVVDGDAELEMMEKHADTLSIESEQEQRLLSCSRRQ